MCNWLLGLLGKVKNKWYLSIGIYLVLWTEYKLNLYLILELEEGNQNVENACWTCITAVCIKLISKQEKAAQKVIIMSPSHDVFVHLYSFAMKDKDSFGNMNP